jgi:hypothetical protein
VDAPGQNVTARPLIIGGKNSIGKSTALTVNDNGTLGVAPTRGALTDHSGTITVGGTSQQLAVANAARSHFEIQNLSDQPLYVNFGAAATIESDSFRIAPGGVYFNPPQYCPNGTITIIGGTTGQKFVAKEG